MPDSGADEDLEMLFIPSVRKHGAREAAGESSAQLAVGESTGMETSGCKSAGMGSLCVSVPAQEGGQKARGSVSPCVPDGCWVGMWALQLALGTGTPLGSVGTSLSPSALPQAEPAPVPGLPGSWKPAPPFHSLGEEVPDVMQRVPKAGDLDAQLVHGPWAMLRRTTHGTCDLPTPQPAARALPAPDPQAEKGCGSKLPGPAGSVVLRGAGQPAEPPGVGSTTE